MTQNLKKRGDESTKHSALTDACIDECECRLIHEREKNTGSLLKLIFTLHRSSVVRKPVDQFTTNLEIETG